jgi:uncharacterized membrane protein
MSDLIVISFKDELKADEVLIYMRTLNRKSIIPLKDAVVVIRNKEGKAEVKSTQKTVSSLYSGVLSGSPWGLFLGLLVVHSPLGGIVGAAVGALSGVLASIGINHNLIREVSNTLEPGTSAILVLTKKSIPTQVWENLGKFEGGVWRTSLSKEDEAKLQKALTKGEANTV